MFQKDISDSFFIVAEDSEEDFEVLKRPVRRRVLRDDDASNDSMSALENVEARVEEEEGHLANVENIEDNFKDLSTAPEPHPLLHTGKYAKTNFHYYQWC